MCPGCLARTMCVCIVDKKWKAMSRQFKSLLTKVFNQAKINRNVTK